MGSATPSVPDTFRQTLDRLGVEDYVLRERMILIHAPGTRFPTTKLDILVVSPFGAFVVMLGMVLGGLAMMLGGMFMMFGSLVVMVDGVLAHVALPVGWLRV